MVLKFSKFLIFCLILKTPLAWGFSIQRLQAYQQTAQTLNLANDPQWLRLGHYHSNNFGGFHSKIRGVFFLSPDGANDPRAELQATLQSLFSEGSSNQQCHYLARMDWLKEKLNVDPQDILACPERDAWKKKLNAQEAYLIFASADLTSAASSFGHTFLRLHNPQNTGNLDLVDYGVNFAAVTGTADGVLFALKGLFGYYPGTFSMEPYHQKIRGYINQEGRDIWEYKMNLTPQQVGFLVDHLLELEGSFIPYYFIDDNCSYEMLEVLEVVRPDLDLTSHFHDATIPIDTLKVLGRQKDFLEEGRERPSLQADFQNKYQHLGFSQKTSLVKLLDQIHHEKSPELGKDPQVMDTALSYLAIQEYRDQKDYKEEKYKLALARSRLGLQPPVPEEKAISPLLSPSSAAFYLGGGELNSKAISQLKWRRAFHDLISRDDGISAFSHLESISLNFQYEYEPKRLNLENFELLKIISTNPVTRLEHPLSWKVDIGTEPKLSPYFEGGPGYSFDVDLGQRSRWIQLALARGFEENKHARLGLGTESLFVQKIVPRLRTLEGVKYLGVFEEKPWLSGEAGISFDVTTKIESRFTYETREHYDQWLLSLIF